MPDSQTPPRTEIQPPVPSGLAPEPPPSDSATDLPEAKGPTRAQVWVHRLLVLLFVFVCAAAGVLLVVLPWTPQWTDNSLLVRYPELRTIMTHGFFRGLCSGLGMLDIWIGFSEAIHYHEDRLP